MRLSEEYCLSEYQELGSLNGNEKVHIVRNRINGLICVRKQLTPELLDIYTFLKNHPNPYIPKIYECICEGHELIVIEEYFTGKNLEEVLREREFSFGEAGRILVDLCRGLRPLHEAEPPIICRDLKTENVILTNEGDVKLIDFDIARIYQPGKVKDTVMMGTEGYAAPEQFGFGQTDARTDIYGMGVLLNYLLTHTFPSEKMAVGRMEPIIRKCIKLNPEDRYQSVDELENELQNELKDVLGENSENGRKTQIPVQTENEPFYKIPGFRSRKFWKMCVAVIGYVLITTICFSMEIMDANGQLLPLSRLMFERFMVWLSQILWVFFVCDYRGIRQKIPVVNHKMRIVRLMGYIVAEFIFLFGAAVVCVFVETFLS